MSMLLFKAAVKGHNSLPSPFWLIAAVIGTLVAMAVLTMIPALLGARDSVAEVLASEAG